MEYLLETLFNLTGSILISSPSNDSEFMSFEVGIQCSNQNKRFASLFGGKNFCFIYFKHDNNSIDKLYQKYPQQIMSSEIASKYWSKANCFSNVPQDLLKTLLTTSYQLVFASLSKKVRSKILEIKDEPNNFLFFHKKCLELLDKSPSFYTQYSNSIPPTLLYNGIKVAYFEFNSLFLRLPKQKIKDFKYQYKICSEEKNIIWIICQSNQINIWEKALDVCLKLNE